MAEASVPQKRRAYYVRWVERFNAFRVEGLRRSFQTCMEGDVVGFLERQRDRSGLAQWQLRQASEALVLFLRRVMGRDEIDARRVWDCFREAGGRRRGAPAGEGTQVPADIPPPVRPDRPEWYQQVQRALRVGHYALRTEAAYMDWLERFVRFRGGRDPRQMGTASVRPSAPLLKSGSIRLFGM